MKPIDHNYLSLQFWHNVYRKSATEFQSFFEDIMQRAFTDFQKIRPYGKIGDAGNDGYRPEIGAYYQVYAPSKPHEKESVAAMKLKHDFQKLQSGWDEISKIRSYHFVFNDKGGGSSIELQRALSELKKMNQQIDFEIFTPKKLEDVFFTLDASDILALGFDIDETKSVSIVNDYLTKIEVDLDRELGEAVIKALTNIEDIIHDLNNDLLQLRFELLMARGLHLSEHAEQARDVYESLCRRFPKDPRAFLYLSEYYLNRDDSDRSDEYLQTAEGIDGSHWLLTLERLIRDLRAGKDIDVSQIDENSFPKDSRVKSNYLRLYAFFVSRSGDYTKARSYIERAISLNPDRLQNYQAQLGLLEDHIFTEIGDKQVFRTALREYLSEIESLEQKVSQWGDRSPRTQATINMRKMNVAFGREDFHELGVLAKESFGLLMKCSFDQQIDSLFIGLLKFALLPSSDCDQLLVYLQKAKTKRISEPLVKALVFQFLVKETLLSKGKVFFTSIDHSDMLRFIDTLENKQYGDTWSILKDDVSFAVSVASAAKQYPELRRLVIQNLPDDGSIQKEKLSLLLNYDEKNYNEAFHLLKTFDLSKLNFAECKTILEIARAKKAWDFVVEIINKLLVHETDRTSILQLKLQLFDANWQLGKFAEAISIGEAILSTPADMSQLDDQNKENLLGHTIYAQLKRGEYKEAVVLLEQYSGLPVSFEFNMGIAAEVYLKNRDAQKALTSIVEAIMALKTPSPEQYGRLFFVFSVIGNLIDFRPTSLDRIVDDSFIKIANQERWYYLGSGNELDATKIAPDDDKYREFLGKRIGDHIVLQSRYRSDKNEYIVKDILTIDKYILAQSLYHAQKLSQEHRWDAIEMIEVPATDKKIDTKYLVARMEDERKKRGTFFEEYCKRDNFPFAFLAVNEGGVSSAVATIVNENRGFIKFSSGDKAEIDKQKDVAKKIISGGLFYIDGTSALVLSETGLLSTIHKYLSGLKVPQSVITMLLEVKDRFSSTPGQVGHMGYAQGKVTFSAFDQEKAQIIQEKFAKCISLLESKPNNIRAISDATKSDCFTEQKIPAELCDACFLAQKDKVLILTEDFLYLQANAIETKKQIPEYSSTYALVRTLYEQKHITFDQYLEYFSYLTSYRFRFLPISTDDIQKAVFGDEAIVMVKPERIRYFNFALTLSHEYGVPFDKAFQVVNHFLIKVLIDDSVTPDVAQTIFNEILSTFPTDKDKCTLGNMFLQVSVQVINGMGHNIALGAKTQGKIDTLFKYAALYNHSNIIRP